MKLTKKIMKCNKKVVSVLLSLTILLTVFSIPVVSAVTTDVKESSASSTAVSTSANQYGLQDNIQDGTILHCFDWKYTDIKAELKNIAEAGFTAVQTSPAQGNNNSGTWYWLYQPRGFYVGTNDIGTKDQLRDLCSEADKYGIKVIVDVVANHLEGSHNNIVDDLKPSQYWHNYGSVSNWNDRYQVTHGDIGMQDLATENSYVQQCVKNYIAELKGLGVDGMRFDAAKHIGLPSEGDNFWSAITSDKSLFYYGEILGGPDDRGTGNEGLMKEYTDYISVTDSGYGYDMRTAFHAGNAPSTSGNWGVRGVSADKLVYWGESHHNWSNNNDWGYSWHISQNNIDRAYAIAAARSGATALYFSRPSTHDKENIKAGQKGSTHFTSPEVAAVNHFHNAMVGQKDFYVNSNNCGVVCREQGAVIVKGSGSGQVTVTNGGSTTKPGTYVDEITGNKWTVTSSTISGTIGSTGIAVIYNPTSSPSNTISQAGGSFKSDTLTLNLGLENATSGTYQI
ncbi:MAG: alpha-amylase family protein, partial [Ruminococcus sp.]